MSGNTCVFIACILGSAFNINVWCNEISKGSYQLPINDTKGTNNHKNNYLSIKTASLENRNPERFRTKSTKDAHIDISSFIKVSKNGTDRNRINALLTVSGHMEKSINNDTGKHLFRPVENKAMNENVHSVSLGISKNALLSKNRIGKSKIDYLLTAVGHLDKPIVNNTAKHFFVPVESITTTNKNPDKNTESSKTIEETVITREKHSDILYKSKLNFHQLFHLFNMTVNDLLLINKMARHGAKLILKHANSDRLNYTVVSSHVGSLTAKVLTELYNKSYESTKMALFEILSKVTYSWSPWSDCSVTCGPNGFKQRLLKVQIGKRVLYTDVHQAICPTHQSCPVHFTSWGEWSGCSSRCSPSYSVRKRYCLSNDCSSSIYQTIQRRRCLMPTCKSIRRKPILLRRPHILQKAHNSQHTQDVQQLSKSYRPQSLKHSHNLQRVYKTYKQQNLRPSKTYGPQSLQQPYNIHQHPHRKQRPYNIHQPLRVQQPYRIHPPNRIQQPYRIHPRNRIQQPYRIHPPNRIQQPYRIHPSYRIHAPYRIHPPYRIHQPHKMQPVTLKPIISTTVATITTSTTQMTTTSQLVIKGYWSPWTKWSACSATCGLGLEFRQRECVSHKRFRNEKVVCFQNLYKQTRTCIQSACNRDSVVSEIRHVIQGTDTTLQCKINNRHLPKNVYWITPKGKKITRHTKSQRYRVHHSKLTISETQWKDRGEYHCVAVDGDFHQVTADAMIYVLTCQSHLCKNGALCLEENVGFGHRHTKCHCKHGFYGRLCEKKDHTDLLYIVTGICSAVFVAFTFSLFVHWLWKKRGKNNKTVSLDAFTIVRKADLEKDKDKTSKKFNTSVVSNDQSLIEIEENDYKNFNEQNLSKDRHRKKSVGSHQKLTRQESISTTRKDSDSKSCKEKVDKHGKSDVKTLKSSSKIKSNTNNDMYETVHKPASSQVFKAVSFDDELCIDLTDENNRVIIQNASTSNQQPQDIYQNFSIPVLHQTTSKQHSALSDPVLNNTRSTKQSSVSHNQLQEQQIANTSSAHLSSNFLDSFSNLEITHMNSKRPSSNKYENVPDQKFSKSHVLSSTEPEDIYNPLIQHLSRQQTDIYLDVSDQGVETEYLPRQPTDIYLNISGQGVETDIPIAITHNTTSDSCIHQLSWDRTQDERETLYDDDVNYENHTKTEQLEHFHNGQNGFSHRDFIKTEAQRAEENETPYIDNVEATTQQTQDHENFDITEASNNQNMIGSNLENGSEIIYQSSSCPSTLVEDLVTEVVDGEAQKLMNETSSAVSGEQHFLKNQSALENDLNIVHEITCNPDTLSDQNENFKVKQEENRNEILTTEFKEEMDVAPECPSNAQCKNESGLASKDHINISDIPSSSQAGDSTDQQVNDTDLSAYKDCTSTVDTTLNSTDGYKSCGETPDALAHVKGENWITLRPGNELNSTHESDSVLQHQDWDVYIDDELYGTEEIKKTKVKDSDGIHQMSSFSFTQEKENIFGEDDFLDELDDEWND